VDSFYDGVVWRFPDIVTRRLFSVSHQQFRTKLLHTIKDELYLRYYLTLLQIPSSSPSEEKEGKGTLIGELLESIRCRSIKKESYVSLEKRKTEESLQQRISKLNGKKLQRYHRMQSLSSIYRTVNETRAQKRCH